MRQLAGKRLLLLGGAALVVLVLGILVLRGGPSGSKDDAENKPDASAPITVDVSRAVLEPVTEYAEATGTVKSATQANIAPKIMSNVSAVYVREGDHVRRGQMLVKLEAADLSAQVAQASAAVAASSSQAQAARRTVTLQEAQSSADVARATSELTAAREQLSLVKKGPRKQQRSQAHLAVAQAKAQFTNAEIELKRMKRLFDEDVVPQQRVDQAQMSYDVAKAQYEAAGQQADMTEEGSREEDIRTAAARVSQAQDSLRLAKAAVIQNRIREEQAKTAASEVGRAAAGLQYARVQQGYATIVSPVDGIVTSRLVDPGATVSPGTPILTIENSGSFRLEAGVSESDLPLLSVGMLVDVKIDASGQRTQGRVVEIVPSGDAGSRKFTVKVQLPAGTAVRTGQFGRISFPRSVLQAVTVPSEAVRDTTGITSVFLAGKEGKAHMQVVKAGKTANGRTEIISGLSGGEEIITSNGSALADGTPIKRR